MLSEFRAFKLHWRLKNVSVPVPVKIIDQGLEVRDEVVVLREG